MNRRNFIRLVGGGLVLSATASCAPTPPDVRTAWVNPGAGETDPRRKALSFAILAPNPHNMQPWMADLSTPGEIAFYVDRTRLLPVTDPFNRQITIGFGAVLELLRMALAQDGIGTSVTLFPDGEPLPTLDDRPLARVKLEGPKPARDPLFAHVLKRRTDRGAFADPGIEDDDVQALQQATASAGGVRTTVSVDEVTVLSLIGLVYEGARIEANTPAAHHESVERTFIGKADVAAHPWGISLDQPAMNAMNAVGLLTKAKMVKPGTLAFKESLKFLEAGADSARGFIWVTSTTNTRADQIEAGRLYVRANLAAAGRGLAMHPWSQGLQEYATQKPVYDSLHGMLAPEGGRIQMLARIGYPKGELPPAPRRGLAAQIRKA
jgi:hypothetical protein